MQRVKVVQPLEGFSPESQLALLLRARPSSALCSWFQRRRARHMQQTP